MSPIVYGHKLSATQTSVNVAATIVAAEITASLITNHDEVLPRFNEIKDGLFAELDQIATAEDAETDALAASKTPAPVSYPTASQVQSTNGAGADFVLAFGKFKGLTIGDVLAMDTAQTAAKGYMTGNGRKYVEWLAQNTEPKAAKSAAAAKAALGQA